MKPLPVRAHTPEPEPGRSWPEPTATPQPTAPPIEDERGPQHPVREPGGNPPERVDGAGAR